MSDETRPDAPDTTADTPVTEQTPQEGIPAGQDRHDDPPEQDTIGVALDADDDPDSLAGALTTPDLDLSHLETAEDEDGGDDE